MVSSVTAGAYKLVVDELPLSATVKMRKKNQTTPMTKAATALAIAKLRALFDALSAPCASPIAHLELTCVENTMETTPSGRQQRIVVKIAHTK